MVYNLHHGHDHLDRFPELLAKIKPYLRALNLNGMDRDGERIGRKILPLGQGALDLELLRTIVASGYQGPIGILGHTMDDAEERLRDNLDGLDWLVPQLDGHAPGPRPKPRTPVPAPPPASRKTLSPAAAAGIPVGTTAPFDPALVTKLLVDARAKGDPAHGAAVFASPNFACISCHRVGDQGGTVGPDLTTVGVCVKPEDVVESILWPRRQVKEGYSAITVATADGKLRQGYGQVDAGTELVLRDPSTGENVQIAKSDIETIRQDGTLDARRTVGRHDSR